MTYKDGEPNWVDLGSPNLDESKRFYTQLFGWEYTDLGPEAGGYNFILSDGKQVGGLGPLMEGQTSGWTTYFQVADAEATSKAVVAAGGTVRMPVMDVMGQNDIAAFTDPSGGEFAVSKPKKHKGAEIMRKVNSPCWFEYSARSIGDAKDFYTKVFGWTLKQADMTTEEYILAKAPGADREFGALMPNPTLPAEHPPYWGIYFEVADVDSVVAKATDMGGRVLMPATTMEKVGRMAALADQHGAIFSLLAPEPHSKLAPMGAVS